MVRMVLWSARVAVILVWGNQSVSEADAGAVLPDLAGLALDHHSHMVYSFHSIAWVEKESEVNVSVPGIAVVVHS